jgi:hypothetical protein
MEKNWKKHNVVILVSDRNIDEPNQSIQSVKQESR